MRIFIACNSYLETGGVELIHQLAWQLNIRNIDCYIIYPLKTFTEKDPTPEVYKKYGAKIASEYLDAPDSIYIVSEVFLQELALVRRGRAVVWWLSVDNRAEQKMEELKRDNILHLVQSHYAASFLENSLGIKEIYYLSDYISDVIRKYGEENRNSFSREDICFYNPQKGLEKIKKLMEKTEGRFQWVPITGYQPIEVAAILCRGKVYIDMGSHPGKDRIPREAAFCGCCVITNRRGSAAFKEDVDIPAKYKISDEEDYEGIVDLIDETMRNYESVKDDFVPYIHKISKEKEIFAEEVDRVVKVFTQAAGTASEQPDVDTVVRYLQMMNKQLERITEMNEGIRQDITDNLREKCVHMLLEEDGAYREMLNEIWELMRYLTE